MDSKFRSLLKAVSWRLIALLITSGLTWALTGDMLFAASLGVLDTALKIGLYYMHERTWNTMHFGRVGRMDYEI